MKETSPNLDVPFPGLPRDRRIKVFVEYSTLKDHLTDERFERVDTPDEADVIWTFKSWKDFKLV